MKKTTAAAVAALAVASSAAVALAASPVASAVVAPPPVRAPHVLPTPSQKTCGAFRTWSARRTTANLDALMTDSESAPWKYLGDDVTQLYSGVREGDAKYVAYAVRYVTADCAKVNAK